MKKKKSKKTNTNLSKVKSDKPEEATAIAEDIISPKKAKDKPHYVNAKEFEEEIKKYYDTGKITIKLGESLNKIAKGLSYAPNFINYTYKEDMMGDAIVKMFSALRNKKFKLNSGFSPFSYFTTIAFHAFINRIKKEKKHSEMVNEYKDRVYTDLMSSDSEYNIYTKPNKNENDSDSIDNDSN